MPKMNGEMNNNGHSTEHDPLPAESNSYCAAQAAYRRALSSHPDLAKLQDFIERLDAAWPVREAEITRQMSGDSTEESSSTSCEAGSQFGRFTIRRLLGEGGFGIVFLAYDPNLGRTVALKLPRPEILLSESLRTRFVREGRAGAALSHRNILPVYEAGDVGGIGYIASSYCAGPTLAEWLSNRESSCPTWTAANIVAQLARAVHHAHQRGVLHRDLKPSNVLLDVDESRAESERIVPLLTDFGLAKQVTEVHSDTGTGALAGTPRYMAPEQLTPAQADVGVFTDVYALGVILFELLVGRVPFEDADLLELTRKIRDCEPAAPSRLRTDVAIDLEKICLKCLEKSPSHRYDSAIALADDLNRYLRGEEVRARRLGRAQRVWRGFKRRPLVSSLSVLLVATITIGLAAISVQWPRARKYNAQLEEHLLQSEQDLTNWAWVNEEAHSLSYSNHLTSTSTRERLKRYYERLLNEPAKPGASRPYLASRHAFAARLALLNDDHAAAERHLDESLERWRELRRVDPTNENLAQSLAATLYLHSVLLRKTQRIHEPLAIPFGNDQLYELLLREDAANGTVGAAYARQLGERGDALLHLDMLNESTQAYCMAAYLWNKLRVRFPSKREFHYAGANALLNVAVRQRERDDIETAVSMAREAEQAILKIAGDEHGSLDDQFLLGQIRRLLGQIALETHSPDAVVYFESARTLFERQRGAGRPEGVLENLRISVARRLGEVYRDAENPTRAIERFAESTTLALPLSLARKISRENAERLGDVHRALGDLYESTESVADALREWHYACHVFANPLIEIGDQTKRDISWSHCLEKIGRVEQKRNQLRQASDAFAAARALLEKHPARAKKQLQRLREEIADLDVRLSSQ